ncbi:uncharacterized protein TRUGW13939_11145 [Talaromyces rugulosus]|uniref:EGF-like domain-containing protein n=1 Tax=Talaromyces rugulosus TaxID=121627 RepID=A0A7H8RC09_TALRU|nr:uncharacterized protein TRUGW13939_11145 [Talaromyces rugulosus]QKX63972.1 hypothetical protein TRUGW13939_11145 [Talaromyces rugulosus]
MSWNPPAPGPGRNPGRGPGSVKRAREMLEAGVRPQAAGNNAQNLPVPPFAQGPNPRGPPPQRPQRPQRPSYYDQGRPDDSTDGEINIGYQVDSDPRGPVPYLPIQGLPVPRQTAPPPSSRRGRMSSFSRGTFVSPIPEEVPDRRRRKKGSFASSAAIPSSWGSGVPASDILDYYDSGDDAEHDADPTTIVRHASLGKRGKPSLRTISKATSEGVKSPLSDPVPDLPKANTPGDYSQARKSFDSDSTDSIDLEKRRLSIENEQQKNARLAMPGPGFSSKRNARRPPRLDLGTVRNAEARGSLTSLPDLIRRATRVASNLEHGRTASRIGILDMFGSGRDPKQPKPAHARSSASLSDILASFPPPRTDTPDEGFRGSWPFPPVGATERSRLRNMQTNEDDPERAQGRRFCGMSRRLFIILCMIAVCIVIAAIVIPIVLVVVPRTRDHSTTASTAAAASTMSGGNSTSCDQTLPCLNGGVSVSASNSCSCVCVNGFSGAQCGTATDGSCTTTQVSDTANATVGSSLPDLFATSKSNFSISLNETEIVGLFNSQNVSCTVQNDLVFFNTENSKIRRVPSSPTIVQGAQITGSPNQLREESASADAPPPILSVPSSSSTTASNTLVGGAMETASASTKSEPSKTTTSATASATTTTARSTTTRRQRVFDFARVAVLFILEQTKNVDSASTARSDIALSLLSESDDSSMSKMKVTMADKTQSFVLNFNNFTITLPDGSVVGGSS